MLAYNVETRQYYSVAPSQGYDEKETEEQGEEQCLSEVWISETKFKHYLSRDARKPVFGISDQVRHKPGCTSSEAG